MNGMPTWSGPEVKSREAQLEQQLARVRAELANLRQENRHLLEKLNAALDGTGICLWQGLVQSGELTVFNLQNFEQGQMAPHFDLWQAKLHPDDKAPALARYFGHLDGLYPSYEAKYRTLGPHGEITWLWDRGRVVEWDAQGRPYRIMGSHIDITEQMAQQAQLEEQAQLDQLTGLYNRHTFTRLTRQRLALGGRGALLFIDLDDFKAINDRFGHPCGDAVLSQVGQWLCCRLPTGSLYGRYGGDEFVAYVPGLTPPQAEALLSRLLAERPQYPTELGDCRPVGLSIGGCCWQQAPGFEQALASADRAMYQAKQQGKRGFWLDCL
ncbi:sensor domain-containing diguanylate cyclase [Pseudaeromonas paramecii]|uniref:Sensor domain-containing diguanylate cyclase n=2 Tax=Pseudaeromonas paramecii TaxID=2138166 RepID=A0ABP8QEA1_9GAMM